MRLGRPTEKGFSEIPCLIKLSRTLSEVLICRGQGVISFQMRPRSVSGKQTRALSKAKNSLKKLYEKEVHRLQGGNDHPKNVNTYQKG